MNNNSSSFFKSVGVQVTAILIAALGAATITFFQSLASQTGVCPLPAGDPATAGVLGAAFKTIHWTIVSGGRIV